VIKTKLSLLDPVKDHAQISLVFYIYVFIHITHVILHCSDGMTYLVADGVNSLRQGRI
jgi:hypothetical protein